MRRSAALETVLFEEDRHLFEGNRHLFEEDRHLFKEDRHLFEEERHLWFEKDRHSSSCLPSARSLPSARRRTHICQSTSWSILPGVTSRVSSVMEEYGLSGTDRLRGRTIC